MKFSAIVFLVLNAFSITAFSSSFYSCKGEYALCTTAACTPVEGKRNLLNCSCDVKKGYSVGQKNCKPVEKTAEGTLLYSRYFPIKSYVICNNNRPWAWCLDKSCKVDKNNPTKASCACTIARNKSPYIIVTNKATATTCTTGIISSASLEDVNDVNNFIKTQKEPKLYPINVLKN
jgi:hypothetical protein